MRIGVLPVANPNTNTFPYLFFFYIYVLIIWATFTDASWAVVKNFGYIF